MKHFGIPLVKRKYAFRINREEFALISTKPSLPRFESLVQENAYTDDTASEYTLAWCEAYRKLCLQNYDLNMEYFSLLDRQAFQTAVTTFLKKHKQFRETDNLPDYEGVSGYYMMILDEYKQVYIGKSNNIMRRIRQHWNKTREFDRTLLPMYAAKESCFSIDFFRALDTTRIFVWESALSEGMERKLIEDFPSEYCTNRIGGDMTNGLDALLTMNRRSL